MRLIIFIIVVVVVSYTPFTRWSKREAKP